MYMFFICFVHVLVHCTVKNGITQSVLLKAPTIRVREGENFHKALLQAGCAVRIQKWPHLLGGSLPLPPEEHANSRTATPPSTAQLGND